MVDELLFAKFHLINRSFSSRRLIFYRITGGTMNPIRQRFTYFFGTFSLYNFLILSFGLPFLTEGLFLFFRQSFLNNLYSPFYLLLFFALIFLFGNLFSQVQSNERAFQNFSLKASFVSFAFWLLLSPLFSFDFIRCCWFGSRFRRRCSRFCFFIAGKYCLSYSCFT